MAASTIGAYTFLTLRNEIPWAGELVADITRPGVAGVAFQTVGLRAQPSVVIGIKALASLAQAGTSMANYIALQGTIVTVTDDFNISRSNILVRRVASIRKFAVASSGPSGTAAIMYVLWELQDTSTSY